MGRGLRILVVIIIALIAGILVYYTSPSDWPSRGEYMITVKTGIGGRDLYINASFTMNGVGKTVSITPDNHTVLKLYVEPPDKLSPGSYILVKVYGVRGNRSVRLSIADTLVKIRLPDGRVYEYSPTGRENYTIIFRIQPYVRAREAGFIFGSAIVLFASASIIHYVITGLYVVLALTLTGIQPAKSAYVYFMKPLIMVFIAGSAIELVIRKTGLDKRIASTLVRIARGPYSLIIGVSFLGSFLSMWMSNTAATYVMMPLALALLADIGAEKIERYRSIVMVSLAMGASIGGTATLIGTPPNLIAAGFLNDIVYGYERIGFEEWLLIGVPAWIIGFSIGILLAIIYARMIAPGEIGIVRERLRRHRARESKPLTERELKGFLAILFLVALWLLEPIHHVSTGVAAGIGLLVFLATGLIDPREDWKKLAWDLMVLFGAGLTLGSALMNTGWAYNILGSLKSVSVCGWLCFPVVGFTAYIIGTFISSHTSASAFIAPLTIPLGMIIGPIVGLSPETSAALTTIVAVVSLNNAIALPISTPPSAIVYAGGKARLKDLVTYGLIFGILANLAIILLLTSFWALIL